MKTRKRFQRGSIQKETWGDRKVWVGLYRDETGKRVKVNLGDRSGGDKSQPPLAIRNKLAKIVQPVNEARAARQANAKMTLAAFVTHHYISFGERKWKASTAATTKQRLIQHLVKGELGQVALGDLDRENMQRFLDRKGISPHSVVSNLRWDLKAVLDLAVSDGILARNQAEMLFVPRSTASPKQPVMTPEQVQQLLGALDLRERLFCRFAIYAGMRPGEIIALRWSDIDGAAANVDDRWYEGASDTPKNNDPRRVALSPAVVRDLNLWRAYQVAPDAFIFPSEKLTTPIRYENLWKRVIRPKLETIGLEWADFRSMRRTNSTLMRAAGADPKVAADNRGHGLGVAMEVYTKSTDGQKQEAVGKLEKLIQ